MSRTLLAFASYSCGALHGAWPRKSMMLPLCLAMAVVLCARSALCQKNNCTEPASLFIHYRLQPGAEHQKEFPVGTTLTYCCGQGYTNENDTWNATCLQKEDESLYWVIGQHDCRPVSCGHPGHVLNGRLSGSEFVFPRSVVYECNRGYWLKGKSILYCQLDAQWNAPKPECHIVQCGTLENITNGFVNLSGTTFGSKAEFSCNHGFKLVGNSTRTCGADGRWTDEPPHCEEDESNRKRKACQLEKRQSRFKAYHKGIPVTPEGPFEHGTELVFHCEPVGEVHFEGPRTARCIDEKWDPKEPFCYPLGPSDIRVRFPSATYTAPRGIVYVEPYSHVVVECWSNSRVELSLKSDDQSNAQFWCPPLSSKSQGLRMERRTARSYHFTCMEGYQIVGEPDLHCQKHGWSDPIPKCEPISGASNINGTSHQTEQTEAQTAHPAGPSGATLSTPERTEKYCLAEKFLEIAPPGLVIALNETQVPENSTFWAFCDDGFTFVGNVTAVTCLHDGTWSLPPHITCIEACGNFDAGPGGPALEGRKESYDLGDSITLSCKNGTELQPRIERLLCLGDRWSENAVPICVPAKVKTNGAKNEERKRA
ncbi:sushi, von Willebrand factor type A, EGF and pentraxin domain-containing protein 1-like isoform X2 [Amblyomma americanum]